jgi:hypothetical protein
MTNQSVALGNAFCQGLSSVAIGTQNYSNGDFSTAMGLHTVADSYCEMAIGRFCKQSGGDANTWRSQDPIFEIGIGTNLLEANALTVLKNGNVGIGKSNPGYLLEMEASGGGHYDSSTHQWVAGSTRAIKQDIKPNSMDLQKVLDQVEVVNYRYKTQVAENPSAPYHIGFIADDTPELLSGTKRDGVQTTDCIGLLLAVVKEQQKEIETLKTEMKELRR